MNDLKYKYYVTYIYTKGRTSGNGSIFLSRSQKMNTEDDIMAAQDYIKDYGECDAVLITFFVLLDGDSNE